MTVELTRENKSIPTPRDGSTLYYSLLNLPDDIRLRVLCRLQLIHAISTTLDDVSDAGVAHQKVHWWHEELARLAADEARHPGTQANSDLAGSPIAEAVLLDLLSATADDRFTPPADDKATIDRLQRHTGAALALVSHALVGNDTVLADSSTRYPALATAMGRFNQLQRLPQRLRLGYAVFSEQAYSDFSTSPDALLSVANKPANNTANLPAIEDDSIQALLKAAIEQTYEALTKALVEAPCVPSSDSDCHLPLAIWTNLRHAQLRQWQSLQPNVLQGTVSLTPFRKTLIMWQTRRRWNKAGKLLT